MDNENWRHIQETINMLCLAVCQINATMSDSNQSVETLTQSFTHLANHTKNVSTRIHGLNEADALENFKQEMVHTAEEMRDKISSSVQAFQFYDRVCQRLDHIASSLQKVAEIIANTEQRNNDLAWKRVQQNIKDSYSMEAERIMFEYIMRGASVVEALEIYRHHFEKNKSIDEDGDEIELF